MKTRFPSFRLFLGLLVGIGTTAGALSLGAQAPEKSAERKSPGTKTAPDKKADKRATKKSSSAGKSEAQAKSDERPPLQLKIDRKPIDRNAFERVSYAPVISRTAGSVVHVYSSKTVRMTDLYPFLNDPQFRRFFNLPELGERAPGAPGIPGAPGGRGPRRGGRSGLPDQVQQGLGSGVVISADGYILTNHHVIEGADDVKVQIGDATKRYEAKVVGRDPLTDIAVLKIDATNLSPATFGDSDQLLVGDVVLAIGNPFGVGQSVSRGIVSAVGRGFGAGILEDFIQTDAAINPGNSGGALIDTDGRVVGINTAIISRTGGFNGVGFAIPINLVRNIAEQIVNTGKVSRGMLGVRPQDLDEELMTQFGAEKGAIISDVEPETPAEKAGLKAGDVITKVNNTEIRDSRHLLLTISQLAPDAKVTVEYLRNGKPNKVEVTLMRRPDEPLAFDERGAAKEDVGVLNGVTVADLTPQLRSELNVPARYRGAIITEIDPDSPSAKYGLREGDVILELDGRPVGDAEGAVRLSEEIQGPVVRVRVWREGGPRFIVVDESKK